MRVTSMGIKLYMLVVFVTSVCQGATLPLQRLDCITNGLNNDCIESVRKTGNFLENSPEPFATRHQFSERKKRQVEAVQQVEAQPVDITQATSTEAQPQVENSTSVVLSSSSDAVSPSEIIPSLPPPPHPSATQATAVKPRSCKSGSTWEEECNTCWCLDNGMAACTVKRCEVISPEASAKTTAPLLPTETTPASSTASVQSPASSTQSTTTSEPSQTTSVQSQTTSVQSPTTSVQSQTTAVHDSSSVLPTSTTMSVQSSTSSLGGTS